MRSCNVSTTLTAFTKLRQWNEHSKNHTLNIPVANASEWTPLTIILGGTGSISSFCSLLVDNAISDLLLLTTITIIIVAKKMKLDEGDTECPTMNLAETQALFNDMLNQFKILTEVSEAVNGIVDKLIPPLVAVDGLAIVSMINQVLNGNWSGVAAHGFVLLKDAVTIYAATTIKAEVTQQPINYHQLVFSNSLDCNWLKISVLHHLNLNGRLVGTII